MDEMIKNINLEIALFLRNLKLFCQNGNNQINEKTVQLLLETISCVDELIANANISQETTATIAGRTEMDFLMGLKENEFQYRRYIICRLCHDQIPLTKDDVEAHIHRRSHKENALQEQHLRASYTSSADSFLTSQSTTEIHATNKSSSHGQIKMAENSNENAIDAVNRFDNNNKSAKSSIVSNGAIRKENLKSKSLQMEIMASQEEIIAGEKREISSDQNCSAEFNCNSSFLIRVRGLPWTVTRQEVREFFNGVNILNGENGIHFILIDANDCETFLANEAFIQLATDKDYRLAQTFHLKYLGKRYIEVLKANVAEFESMMSKRTTSWEDNILRLEGLPRDSTKQDIHQLFYGLQVEKVKIICDNENRRTGEAFVKFKTMEDHEMAFKRNMVTLGGRYIKILRSSEEQLKSRFDNNLKRAQSLSGSLYSSSLTSLAQSVKDKSNFNYDCSNLVLVHGLPWRATKKDVREFFGNVNILNGDHGIYFQKLVALEAFVQLASKQDLQKALEKDKRKMELQIIRVTEAKLQDFLILISKKNFHNKDYVIRIEGLQWSVNKQDIVRMFKGLKLNSEHEVHIQYDHRKRATGIAFVQFQTKEDFHQAMKIDFQRFDNKFLRVFKSSEEQLLYSIKTSQTIFAHNYGDGDNNNAGAASITNEVEKTAYELNSYYLNQTMKMDNSIELPLPGCNEGRFLYEY